MDPNSSYLLKIKLVGNRRKVRQDMSCYSFTKVVDADTTIFNDFVEPIVDEFPPRYKEMVVVQYVDEFLKALPEVKTDHDLQLMFDKCAKTKMVRITIAYYNPDEEDLEPVLEWPSSPVQMKKMSRMKKMRSPTT